MKRIAVLSILMLLTGAAAHSDHSQLPDATSKPGSFMYGLERAQESISLALTFSQKAKAQKKLKYAEERLAEAEALSEENHTERAEKALQLYSRQMSGAMEIAENLPENQQVELQGHMNASRQVHQAVLVNVIDRAPESASKGLRNAIQKSPVRPLPENRKQGNDASESGNNQVQGMMATGRAVPQEDQ